jgi:Domain of unknown function (DUF4124)
MLFFAPMFRCSWLRMLVRVIILLFSVPLLMGADIYRYVDANGVVNYVQQLPYGVQGERIKTVAGAPSVAESATAPAPKADEQPPLDPKQQAMLDDLKKADQARKDEIARIRDANCTRSREVLEKLTTYGHLRVTEPDGQQRKMPEEEREQRIAEAQKGIVTNCNPATGSGNEPAVAKAGG